MDEALKEKIYELMNLKYEQACSRDPKWEYENYIWVLGFKALRALEAQGCVITHRVVVGEDGEYFVRYMMGVEIEMIDNHHPNRVSLYKEVV